MGRLHLWIVVAGAAALAGCTAAPKAPPAPVAVAEPAAPPPVAMVFDDGSPGQIAPRFASECTRRRMPVIQNTPERVVCKHIAPEAPEVVGQPAAELWSFLLSDGGEMTTRVEARRSFEAVAANGYAVLSFAEPDDATRMAMRAFMEDLRLRGGLKGPA